MSRRRSSPGWTLIELMIVLMILGFLGAALLRLFTYGLRNTQRVMDVTDQTQIAAIVLRSLEQDLGLALPGSVKTTRGDQGGPMDYAPDSRRASAFIFWVLHNGKMRRIRYEFHPGGGEIQRTVLDGEGNTIRQHSFGAGFIRTFEVSLAPASESLLRVSLTLVGKQKNLRTFSRWFCPGFSKVPETEFWKFWTPSP